MLFYSVIVATTLMLVLLMLLHIKNSTIADQRAKKGFSAGLGILMVVTIIEWLIHISNGSTFISIEIHALMTSLKFSLTPIIAVTWMYAMDNLRYNRLILPILFINILLEFASAYLGFVFFIDANNDYHKGPFYFIYVIMYTAAVLTMLKEAYIFSRKYQNRDTITLFGGCLFLILGIVANMLNSHVHTVMLSVAICSVMFYLYYIELIVQTDSLTKLLNRRAFENHIDQITDKTAVIMLDVDDFKNVNDSYGHAYGDQVLIKISKLMLYTFKHHGLCYRIGGDEFCVILQSNNYEKQLGLCNKLCQSFTNHMQKARALDPTLPTVSIGKEFYDGTIPIEEIIQLADKKMYQTKREKKH